METQRILRNDEWDICICINFSCMSISLYPKTVKPAEPGPNFSWDVTQPLLGKFHGCSDLQNIASKNY